MIKVAVALLIAMLCLVASASSAWAGSYEVVACDAAGGVQRSWVAAVSSDRVSAYTVCPAGGNNSLGILTRNVVHSDGGNGAFGDLATQTFNAPPGTTIAGLTASYDFFKNTGGGWVTGLVAQVGPTRRPQRLVGCYDQNAICTKPGAQEYIAAPPDTRALYVETYCESGFCPLLDANRDGASRNDAQASGRLFSARVVVQDDSAPSLSGLGGSLLSGGWKRGIQTVSLDASDNVGIRKTVVTIGAYSPVKTRPCAGELTVPCPQGGELRDFDTGRAGSDGELPVTITAFDSAENTRTETRIVAVDNSAPATPQVASVDGGEGWRGSNNFRLTWRNPDEAGVAPIAGAEFELCPAGGGPCARDHRDGKDIVSAQDIVVPAPGDYVLRLWLRDEAGNEDRRVASAPMHLRYDNTPPSLSFARQDPGDPSLVAVDVHDDLSGLAGGTVEGKRPKDRDWRPFETRVEGQRLLARIEDETLPDGTYELRARAVDQAGNERSSDRLADGRVAQLALPVRLKTRLAVGITRRAGKRRRILRRSSLRVAYGARKRLTGRLGTADGSPFPDASVTVFEQKRLPGASFAPIATLKTSRTGRFSFLARRGASRVLRFRYEGTATIRPARRDVALGVSASTTFRANRHEVVNGETVRFGGRLRGGTILPEGKLVEVQVLSRRRWRTFATTRADPSGRWRHEYRFDGTRGRVRYLLRARIPRETGYPYATGRSRRVAVTVRGL